MRYRNLCVLAGGLPVWALMGGAVFSGMNVPSKAFGEAVERDLKTNTISAIELKEKLDSGQPLFLLDARPADEHADYCIPESISCPSAEMILRCSELQHPADTEIVVHCAGRTRSIIGAQTLIDSGLFQNISSLCNGTPAWEFAGWKTEKGNTNFLPLPEDGAASLAAFSSAQSLRSTWGLAELDFGELQEKRTGDKTCYIFDIRSAEEFANGYLAGPIHIAGGQLLLTTERYAVVQNADIVLVDSDGVRATTAAVWFRRMGWKNVGTFMISGNSTELVKETAVMPRPGLPEKISIFGGAIRLERR